MLAARLGCSARVARELLSGLRLGTAMPLALLGRLDETWLFRVDARAKSPLQERIAGVANVVEIVELEGPYAIVRTSAQDAIEREKLLRALHLRLGERPIVQLHRPAPPALKRPLTKEDRALVLALRAHPWDELDALAREARVPAKTARERTQRLVAERVVTLEAAPKEGELARVLVRTMPSSTAAARGALDAIEGVVRAWLPAEGEASWTDALAIGAPDIKPARDVPGVASVELLPVRAAWRDDALIDAWIRRAS